MTSGFDARGDSKAAPVKRPAEIPPLASVADEPPAEPAAPPMDPIVMALSYSLTAQGTGPLPRVMQAQRFTERQAMALQALHASMHAQSVRMANGAHVEKTSDALRKFLDDVADAMGLA